MPDFRYAQFCPLARAAEIIGERWTLLIVRELASGPQRFADLRERLPGLSSSVLAERLARMEERRLVRRASLPPPAASAVYELGEGGEALLPALVELARFGLRYLALPGPDDHIEPDWVTLALRYFARPTPTPAHTFAVRVREHGREARVWIRGGPDGTTPLDREPPAEAIDAAITGPCTAVLAFAAGFPPGPDSPLDLEGPPDVIDRLPSLFDIVLGGLETPEQTEPKQGA